MFEKIKEKLKVNKINTSDFEVFTKKTRLLIKRGGFDFEGSFGKNKKGIIVYELIWKKKI